MHQRHVQHITNVHQITLVMAIYVKPSAIMMKIVWLMRNACEVHVAQFVTAMHLAEVVKFAKIAYAKSDVGTI